MHRKIPDVIINDLHSHMVNELSRQLECIPPLPEGVKIKDYIRKFIIDISLEQLDGLDRRVVDYFLNRDENLHRKFYINRSKIKMHVSKTGAGTA